ncbi:NUDIX hydrolase [Patescibacteria group bacterium]|nr:NUDIX hydrolase [Patescibacteria group bacterium]
MEINTIISTREAKNLNVTYRDLSNIEVMQTMEVKHIHAYCFCGDKLVVCRDDGKGYWTFPGGGIEPGESVEEAVIREVHEESNMRVIKQQLIGYQEIEESTGKLTRQTRSVCIVEPYGEFLGDPDGDITAIKLIDPSDYNQYVDWGVVGDHVIKEAVRLYKTI